MVSLHRLVDVLVAGVKLFVFIFNVQILNTKLTLLNNRLLVFFCICFYVFMFM